MRGKHRQGRWCLAFDWRIDLVVAALVLGGVAWLLTPRFTYQPSGDELYDQYASLLVDKFNRAYPNDYWLWVEEHVLLGAPSRTVDLSAVADWEEQYGADPRYWQLRRDCLADGGRTCTLYDDSIRAGVFDEASFFYPAWDVDKTNTALTEQECYDQAIATNPDNAFYYYLKAYYYLYEGRIDDSWAMLRAGHTAPECYAPHPFPAGFIKDNYSLDLAPVNKFAAGRTIVYTAIPDTIPVRESIKQINSKPVDEVSNEYLDDMGWAQLRLIQGESECFIMQLIHFANYKQAICVAAENRIEFTPAQAREYAYIKQLILRIKKLSKTIPSIDYPLDKRRDCIATYDALASEYACGQEMQALFDDFPRNPLSAWARGELASLPVPDDFEPLPKYLPPAK